MPRSHRRAELEAFMAAIVAPLRVLPYGESAAKWHADTPRRLAASRRRGTTRPPYTARIEVRVLSRRELQPRDLVEELPPVAARAPAGLLLGEGGASAEALGTLHLRQNITGITGDQRERSG
jgi:hypothetical protein